MNRRTIAIPLLLIAGCGPTSAPSGLPVVSMDVHGRTYRLEVAATEAAREHGLMERDALPAGTGMIFAFADDRPRAFWMKHTRIPLDIIYATADGTVVSVHTMRPYDESTTPSGGPARYAVELPAHAAAAVKPGDRLTVPPLPGKPEPTD